MMNFRDLYLGNGVVIIKVKGNDTDGSQAHQIKQRIQECLNKGYNKIILDFKELGMIRKDEIKKALAKSVLLMGKSNGKILRLAEIPPNLKSILERSELGRYFALDYSLEKAKEGFLN